MNPSAGLVTALNKMREMSVADGSIYHQYFPIVDANTTIGDFGAPMFGSNYQAVQESFFGLLKQIAYVATQTRIFNNPLAQLEGDSIPLGWAGEETYINPVKGRQFDVNDFAGILQKYEADVKVQYLTVNMDLQYPVTITRDKIRQAFTSWGDLENFINGIVNALYNGAYIGMFQYTKALVTGAYAANKAAIQTFTLPTNEATGKAFIKKLRELHTLFQLPSTSYNAWQKVGGAGRPVTTWCSPEDIMLIIRADILATIDVDVLAAAFNMDKADFIGRVITVDNFDIYDDDGNLITDGSAIIGLICDRSWFKIKSQDMALDMWFNPNNRSWQYYLNVVKMYNYSLFANGVILATSMPSVHATSVTAAPKTLSIKAGEKAIVTSTLTPVNSTATITAASSAESYATVAVSGNAVTITGVAEGSATVTITATNADSSTVTDTVAVTVAAAS